VSTRSVIATWFVSTEGRDSFETWGAGLSIGQRFPRNSMCNVNVSRVPKLCQNGAFCEVVICPIYVWYS
jgi:hypothetical protein